MASLAPLIRAHNGFYAFSKKNKNAPLETNETHWTVLKNVPTIVQG